MTIETIELYGLQGAVPISSFSRFMISDIMLTLST
jgi:hypothetical protein